MLATNCLELEKELMDIVRLFGENVSDKITVNIFNKNQDINVDVIIGSSFNRYTRQALIFDVKKETKYFSKSCLYKALAAYTDVQVPWGSLTGIRPVSLYNNFVKEIGMDKADDFFTDFFDVQPLKLDLLKTISNIQKPYYSNSEKDVALYIGIPFCKGRCSYCSFFSADIDKNQALVEPYIEALLKEIGFAKEILKDNSYRLRSIYIGGGTPSSLPLKLLEKLLSALSGLITDEFTVEAGRADSISAELLSVLQSYPVTRISINTQTSNDYTLKMIGRRHSFNDVIEAFEKVKNKKFIINTDIIAGLPYEREAEFYKSIEDVILLSPENITIHTLALKKGSTLVEQNYKHSVDTDIMLNYAQKLLGGSNYQPYYMYRQKYSAGNLENVGYSKKGKECVYNIDNMDDTVSILACGANAISKKVFTNGRIERLACPKDVRTYINKVETLSKEKYRLFKMGGRE